MCRTRIQKNSRTLQNRACLTGSGSYCNLECFTIHADFVFSNGTSERSLLLPVYSTLQYRTVQYHTTVYRFANLLFLSCFRCAQWRAGGTVYPKTAPGRHTHTHTPTHTHTHSHTHTHTLTLTLHSSVQEQTFFCLRDGGDYLPVYRSQGTAIFYYCRRPVSRI